MTAQIGPVCRRASGPAAPEADPFGALVAKQVADLGLVQGFQQRFLRRHGFVSDRVRDLAIGWADAASALIFFHVLTFVEPSWIPVREQIRERMRRAEAAAEEEAGKAGAS